jgi:hypothetical protein
MNFLTKYSSKNFYFEFFLHLIFIFLLVGYNLSNLYTIKSFDYISYLFIANQFSLGQLDVLFNTTWSPLNVILIGGLNLGIKNLYFSQAIFTLLIYGLFYFRIVMGGMNREETRMGRLFFWGTSVLLFFSFIDFFADPLFVWILAELLCLLKDKFKNSQSYTKNWLIWTLWFLLTLSKGMGLYLALLYGGIELCKFAYFQFKGSNPKRNFALRLVREFRWAAVYILFVLVYLGLNSKLNNLPFNLGLAGKFNMTLIQDQDAPSTVHFNQEDNWKLISKNYLGKMQAPHPEFQNVKYGNWYWLDPAKADYLQGVESNISKSFLLKYVIANLYILAKQLPVFLFLVFIMLWKSVKRKDFLWIFVLISVLASFLMFAVSHIENRYVIVVLLFFWVAVNILDFKWEEVQAPFLKLIVVVSFFSYFIDGSNVLKNWNLKPHIAEQPYYQNQQIPSGKYNFTEDMRVPVVLLKNPKVILNEVVSGSYIDSVKLNYTKSPLPILTVKDDKYVIIQGK